MTSDFEGIGRRTPASAKVESHIPSVLSSIYEPLSCTCEQEFTFRLQCLIHPFIFMPRSAGKARVPTPHALAVVIVSSHCSVEGQDSDCWSSDQNCLLGIRQRTVCNISNIDNHIRAAWLVSVLDDILAEDNLASSICRICDRAIHSHSAVIQQHAA